MRGIRIFIFSFAVLASCSHSEAASLMIKSTGRLYFSAASPENALATIARRHKLPDTGEEALAIDTLGEFDINGMPAFLIRFISFENLQYEYFYLFYSKKGRIHFSPIGISKPGILFSFNNFNIETQKNIYLFLYFQEEEIGKFNNGDDFDMEFSEEPTQETAENVKSKMLVFIAAFNRQHKCRFLAYKVPVSIVNDPILGADYRIRVELESDETLRILSLTKSVHAEQKRLLGKKSIPKF